ncbi:hypothetical protein ACS0TY_018963 [Phlomoides rotata]
MKVGFLAKRCVNVRGEEVAMELEGLRVGEKHSWIHTECIAEDGESLLSKGFSGLINGGNSTNTACGWWEIIGKNGENYS